MKTTVNLYDFRQAFNDMGRGNNFSYEGIEILFDYLERLSDDIGEEIELDVIELCCEYSEATPEEIAKDYGYALEGDNEEERRDNMIEWLNDQTRVCGFTDNNTIVYQQF